MRVFLGIVARRDVGADAASRRAAVDETVRQARRLGDVALPAIDGPAVVDQATFGDGEITLMSWTNELSSNLRRPLLIRNGSAAQAWAGYLTSRGEEARLLAADDPLRASADVGGCFAFYRADHSSLRAVTAGGRTEPVYYATTSRVRLLGSRALLLGVLVSGQDEPRYDLLALRALANNGYLLGNDTPFAGVTSLAASTMATVSGDRAELNQIPAEPPDPVPGPAQWRSLVAEVREAILSALQPLTERSEPVTLSLTGGRDSRLLAAALHASRIPFRCLTNGTGSHPDVVLARAIAERLGVTHDTRAPTAPRQPAQVEHPVRRARRVLDCTDGMTSAWDDVADYGPMGSTPILSGLGGEVLRGGYVLPGKPELTSELASTIVRNIFTGMGVCFTDAANERCRAAAQPWLAAAADDPYEAMDRLYLENRAERWGTARRQAAWVRYPSHVPMLDNRVLQAVRRIPARLRWSERLMWDLISQLAPSIADLPIEKTRWRFEATGPRAWWDRRRWRRRYALTGAEAQAAAAWNRLHDDGLREIFVSYLDDRIGALEGLLKREAVPVVLGDRPPKYPQAAWHLLSTVAVVTERWWSDRHQRSEDVPLGERVQPE